MRIVFIGQAPFGKESLEALLAQGEQVVGAITLEDAPNQKYPNPVKTAALEHGIELYQSNSYKKPEAISWVEQRRPDLLVLAFVTAFVPREMIDLATHGGINYHPSLLPKYRGGSAINWAVISGETETGVTIHFIDEGVDTGPILLQERTVIEPDDTVKSLYFNKLYPMGIRMIGEAVRLIREGRAAAVDQDEHQASFQPLITAADTAIDWNRPTDRVFNLIRGANPSPGAGTRFCGASLKIFDARRTAGSGAPGKVIAIGGNGFTVATADGAIEVLSVQPAGGKKLPALEFVQTSGLKTGETLGNG
jgi:methionyl-tRNA formyltransferase